jgi:hypothetical protein
MPELLCATSRCMQGLGLGIQRLSLRTLAADRAKALHAKFLASLVCLFFGF